MVLNITAIEIPITVDSKVKFLIFHRQVTEFREEGHDCIDPALPNTYLAGERARRKS